MNLCFEKGPILLPIYRFTSRKASGAGNTEHMNKSLEQLTSKRWFFPACLVIVVIAGAWLRFVDLGMAALRADTMKFWLVLNQDYSWTDIYRVWAEQKWHTGHFPFAKAFIKWFLDVFNLDATFQNIRIPSAIWGTLAIPAAYGLGTTFRNRWLGLVLALLTAFNPYLIQFSREAYFYPPTILGSFLVTWSLVWAVRAVFEEWPLKKNFVLVTGLGTFLLIYSLPGGWMLYVLALILWTCLLVYQKRKHGAFDPGLFRGTLVALLLMVPFLFASWGFAQFGDHVGGGSVRAAGEEVRKVTGDTLWKMLMSMVSSWGWGAGGLRTLATGAFVLLGFAALFKEIKTRKEVLLLPILFVASVIVFMIARKSGGMLYQARYMMPALPVFFIFLSCGLLYLVDMKGAARKFSWLVPVAAVLLLIHPAWLSTQLSGRPTPYNDIIGFVNTNMPRDSVILVDRWLEPENELAVHPSTNDIHFAYTVPNEPLKNFQQLQWRRTAQQFFEDYPQAGYLEIAKTFWEVPEVGPWDWPRTHFRNHVVFTNTAGLKLRSMGLAGRNDFYTVNTNRVICELFYNTREDVIEQAQRDGRKVLALFHEGWKWLNRTPAGVPIANPLDQFRNYKIMEEEASLELFNLTGQNQDVVLEIEAMGYRAAKDVVISRTMRHRFAPALGTKMQTGVFTMPPGKNTLLLRDPDWENIKIPLLATRVRLLTKEELVKAQ